ARRYASGCVHRSSWIRRPTRVRWKASIARPTRASCGRRAPMPDIPSVTARSLVREGLAAHQAGDLARAEGRYRAALGVNANHADALPLLGVIALQCGHLDSAIELIGWAIEENGREPQYHHNLGNALKEKKEPARALSAYENAL